MSPRLRRFVLLCLVAGAYIAAGRLSLRLAVVNESASAVWPPSGLAVAALLLLGLRAWPAVAFGAFVVNFSTSGVPWAAGLIALGNTLEGVVGAWLTRRVAGGRSVFDQTRHIVSFVLVASTAATLAASSGTAALFVAQLASPADGPEIWFTWWLGDAVGILLVTPFIVLWMRRREEAWSRRRIAEVTAMGAIVALVSLVVFGPSPIADARLPLAFVVAPLLLWAAFRFGARETATTSIVVAVIAITGTLRGRGPFARGSENEALLVLQGFIGVTTTMALSVAAAVSARRGIESKLRTLNTGLESRVAERTQELVEANERLVEAQQVAHVGSWNWEIGPNRLWWSDELYRIYGITPGTAMDYESYLALVHAEERPLVEARVGEAMQRAEPFSFEHRITRPDGDVRVLHAAGRVIVDGARNPVRMMGIGHDITERKRAEQERVQLAEARAAREEAEATSRAKDEFLAILSHELRTPLNAALGWAHTLRELPPGDPRGLRAVEAISRNLTMQARLVSDIIDASRIARGGMVLEKAPIEAGALIQAALDIVRDQAAARRIRIECDLPSEPVALVGDAKRLQQVLWNVVSNGVRFGRDEGWLHVGLVRNAQDLTITVDDDGPGIDPGFLPHMFEPFRQADGSPARQHDGLGLGLAIARHIVELHGGVISASNRASGGARLTIRLPVAPATPSHVGA